jgi:hypothetical protein
VPYHSTLIKILLCISLLIPIPLFALKGYTISQGDTLWTISKDNKPTGVSISNMVKAIKGLNFESHPNIVNNIIQIGSQLTLPTSKKEVTDSIELFKHHQTKYIIEKKETTTKKNIVVPNINKNLPAINNNKSKGVISDNNQIETNSHHTENYKKIIPWVVLAILCLAFLRRKRKQRKQATASTAKQRFSGGIPSNESEPKIFSDNSFISIDDSLINSTLLLKKGRIQDAKVCLQNALNIYHDNVDIRLKLLEIYGKENDIISFNSEKDYLAAHILSHDDERWNKVDEMYNVYFLH